MNLTLASDEQWRIIQADTLELLPQLPDASVDAVVCDPPYGIDFDNQRWDGTDIRRVGRGGRRRSGISAGEAFQRWAVIWAAELARVVKPGGHVVAFGAPRVVHRLAAGLEDGGLEIRDMLMWMYSSGMPKSRHLPGGRASCLKPFYEPIVLARRPTDASLASTLERYGTGALNIEDCAIDYLGERRWPANVLIDEGCAGTGAADLSRFLFCSKASRRERDAGCEQLPFVERELFPDNRRPATARPPRMRNTHPTVKPVAVMSWLIRLVTPPEGVVLDPFCGSGTTGIAAGLEGRRFVGIERDGDHAELARTRIAHWLKAAETADLAQP